VVVFASYGVLVETWRRTVVAWGERLRWADAARIWFVSNLGKYVPGKIWQIGAMGALAQRAGVSAVAAIGSSLVVNLVNVAAGFMVVALAGSARLAGRGLLPGIAVFLVGLAATPWLLPHLVRLASRLTGREWPAPRIPSAAIVVALVGCTVAWGLYGFAFRELAVALFGPRAGSPATYTAVFTLSYLVGYLTFLAPGGVGARELSLLALLPAAGLEVGAQATLLVIVSRLWLTMLEAVPGLVLLAARRPSLPNSSLSQNGSQTDDSRSN
jgi:glycosyltransferase 2 family protein